MSLRPNEPPNKDGSEGRDVSFAHLVAVFSVASAMVGVCLTAIGIIQIVSHNAKTATAADEVLVLVLFLLIVSCLCSFVAMRLRFRGPWRVLMWIADISVLVALAMIALGGAIVVLDFGR
jgi:hypothetical protein